MACHSGRGTVRGHDNFQADWETDGETLRQTDRPISVVSNSTHSQLERPINSLTGATLVRHLARDGWRGGWREGKLEVLWGICFDSDSDSETAMWPVSHIKLINN